MNMLSAKKSETLLPDEKPYGVERINYANYRNAHTQTLSGVNQDMLESLAEKPHLREEWDIDTNGVAIETVSPNSKKDYAWTCRSCSHRWHTPTWNRVLYSGHCPQCARKEYHTRIEKLLEDKKYALISPSLSTLNVDETHELLHLECEKNHKFRIGVTFLLRGKGCDKCLCENRHSNAKEEAFERAKTMVKAIGGIMLTEEYKGSTGHHEIQCHRGHKVLFNNQQISSAHSTGKPWCNRCKREDRAIAKQQKISNIEKV